jgi:hypothetical protein
MLILADVGLVRYVRYGLLVRAMLAGSAAPVAPQGQRAFEVLDARNFGNLRDVFNAHGDRTRVPGGAGRGIAISKKSSARRTPP